MLLLKVFLCQCEGGTPGPCILLEMPCLWAATPVLLGSFISLSSFPCWARAEPCSPVGLRASYITFISPFPSYLLSPWPHAFPTGINTENLETEHSGLFQKAEIPLCWVHVQHEVGLESCEELRWEDGLLWATGEDLDKLYLTLVFLGSQGGNAMISKGILGCHSWEEGWTCYWHW